MKKLILALSFVAALTLCTSCGNKSKKDDKVDLDKVAEKMMKEAFEGESYSKEAAEFYFKKNEGIKLSDLAPEYDLDETSKYTYYGDERDVLLVAHGNRAFGARGVFEHFRHRHEVAGEL